jgi:hypothetical protein
VTDLSRLTELARIAAEQVLDMLTVDNHDLVDSINVRYAGPAAGQDKDVLRVEWLLDYGEDFSQPVSMFVLAEHLEDEEALVLSFAAWLLQAVSGGNDDAQA